MKGRGNLKKYCKELGVIYVVYFLIGQLVMFHRIDYKISVQIISTISLELIKASIIGLILSILNRVIIEIIAKSKDSEMFNFEFRINGMIKIEKLYVLFTFIMTIGIILISFGQKESIVLLFLINTISIYHSAKSSINLLKEL